jgi:hypothetical protein
MMDIYSGEFEAMALVILAIIGLTLGGFLAFGSFLISAIVRKDVTPRTLKGWAISALLLLVINAFAFGWLTDLGRQNFQRDAQEQPNIEPPIVLVASIGIINLLAPTIGALSPIVAFWITHKPYQG